MTPTTPSPLSLLFRLLARLLAAFCALSLLGALACAGDPPPSCGALGLVAACPCPGGGQGAQECGPAGVWGPCVCGPADAGGDVGADAGTDAPDVAVAAADGRVDVPAADAAPSGALAVAVSAYPADRWVQVSARCAASGWGTVAGVAATVEAGYLERGTAEPVRAFRATVSPGVVGSVALEGERVTSGVMTSMGDPYRSSMGERVDFETRASTRTQGPVALTVVGCPVVP